MRKLSYENVGDEDESQGQESHPCWPFADPVPDIRIEGKVCHLHNGTNEDNQAQEGKGEWIGVD